MPVPWNLPYFLCRWYPCVVSLSCRRWQNRIGVYCCQLQKQHAWQEYGGNPKGCGRNNANRIGIGMWHHGWVVFCELNQKRERAQAFYCKTICDCHRVVGCQNSTQGTKKKRKFAIAVEFRMDRWLWVLCSRLLVIRLVPPIINVTNDDNCYYLYGCRTSSRWWDD